jgi:hypothetical protein
VKERPEIEVLLQEPVEPQQSSLGTLKMAGRPELDYPVAAGEPFLATAEPWSVSLPAVEELINQFAKLEHLTTSIRQSVSLGPELEEWL